MFFGQWTILLGDAGNVGTGIEYPDVLSRVTLLEEDDVCLGGVCECALSRLIDPS